MEAGSERTKLVLDNYLRDSMRVSTKGMSPLEELTSCHNIDGERLFSRFMLTISGVDLRLTMLLHHPVDQHGVDLYSYLKSANNAYSEDDAQAFFQELANQTCAEIKRYLQFQFQFLGMSTPLALSATTSLSDFNDESCVAAGDFYLARDGNPVLGASAYLYSSAKIVLQYDQASTADIDNSGELEFF
jgi:hypothetical protein